MKAGIKKQSLLQEKSDPAQDFRIAKEYWLQTVQPYIKGRKLFGVELYVAQDAHLRLRRAAEKANERSELFEADELHEPEELCRDENLKPETLAHIAMPLLKNKWLELTPADAVRRAHEMLIEAERYIKNLPAEKRGTEKIFADLEQAFSTVTFGEILQSSDENSGQVPLLRGVQKKRAKLTLPALKKAIHRFLEREKNDRRQFTKKEWNEDIERTDKLAAQGKLIRIGSGKSKTYDEWKNELDEEIKDCLQNKRICLQRLCDLRWQRFKTFWENQSERRKAKK